MLHSVLLHAHNGLRWVVLAAGAFALVRAVQGRTGDRPYAAARRAGVAFMASLHVQLLLGVALFLTSPLIAQAMQDMKATMSDAPTRFFIAEHPMTMVVAVVLATVGAIVAKNGPTDAARHRRSVVFTGVTLLLLLGGIPWQRPWM